MSTNIKFTASFFGRRVGAIGLNCRYGVIVEIPDDTPEDKIYEIVRAKVYETHEHLSDLQVTRTPAHPFHVDQKEEIL